MLAAMSEVALTQVIVDWMETGSCLPGVQLGFLFIRDL